MMGETYPFECPECGYETEFRTKLGGAFGVFRHYRNAHPEVSYEIGHPLDQRDAPEFENGRPSDSPGTTGEVED